MIITIPFKTPTVNLLYGQRKTGFGQTRFLKKEAVELREEIKEIIVNTAFPLFSLEEKPLEVFVEIHENWLCKDGSVKKKDLANREKFLIDSIFNALGIDDKFIFKHTMEKVQSNEEKSIIKIEELNESNI